MKAEELLEYAYARRSPVPENPDLLYGLGLDAIVLLREVNPFTNHTEECRFEDNGDCTCGFSKWLEKYGKFLDGEA